MKQSVFLPIAVDLFAGCGGISEGFSEAGYSVAAYLEKDESACRTLRTRIMFRELLRCGQLGWYRRYLRGDVAFHDVRQEFGDISDLIECRVTQKEFGRNHYSEVVSAIRNALKLQNASRVHVLLGGPPCQAYSLVGRSRDEHRMCRDERHFLYQHYLDVLAALEPDFFLMENVPGLLTARARGQEIFQKMLDDLASIHPPYGIAPSYEELRENPRGYLVDSWRYAVPQRRQRVMLIGYRRDLAQKHPSVTHAFMRLRDKETKEELTVRDAIKDLPKLKPGEGNDRWFGAYPNSPLSEYQRQMRTESPGVLNHCARTHMAADLQRYRFFIKHTNQNGDNATLEDLHRERPDILPKHKNLEDFVDRFKVQRWDRPSFTIMSHIAKDGHYFIHPDLSQCRSFTVREAARCQSFPDNYFFEGPRTEQFRQVGNAVPPRLAKAVAEVLLEELKKIYGT